MRWRPDRGVPVVWATAAVLGCAVYAAALSLRWPLVGDASLMHYVVFLIGRGLVPYRDIVDINLPGTYLFEGLGMRLLGSGALAWRIYDLLLLTAAGAAMVLLAGRRRWPAGLLAAGMFALLHLQDGIAQTGQRDLLIAVLLLWAYVALFAAQRLQERGVWLIFVSTLLCGVTVTIKPTYLPLGIVLLVLAGWKRDAWFRVAGVAGLLLPGMVCLLWLTRIGALPAFLQIVHSLIPLHAELGRRSVSYLLTHATAPVSAVVGLWLLTWLVGRPRLDRERLELLAGVLIGLVAYVAQGKGYPYHRYPLLALLLLGIEMDLCAAWQASRWPLRVLAGVALAVQCGYLAPHAAWQVRFSIRPAEPFEDALSNELRKLGPGLSGDVQCLDTFGGCVNTLFDLRLEQASGYLYDCYLFTESRNDAVARYREGFLQAYEKRPSRVLVLTDQYCFGEQGGFARVGRWPVIAREIANHYTQRTEWHSPQLQHWFSRGETVSSFRMYVRNPDE